MVLPETDLQRARSVAERLMTATELLDRVTFSIGIAEAALSMSGIPELLRAADKALYGAKSAGRNCIWSDGAIIEFPKKARPR